MGWLLFQSFVITVWFYYHCGAGMEAVSISTGCWGWVLKIVIYLLSFGWSYSFFMVGAGYYTAVDDKELKKGVALMKYGGCVTLVVLFFTVLVIYWFN